MTKLNYQTGVPISDYRAACAAGAVFGTITWLARLINGICDYIEIPWKGTKLTIFGCYKVVQLEVDITEYERTRGLELLQNGLLAMDERFEQAGKYLKETWIGRLKAKADERLLRTNESRVQRGFSLR